MNKNLVVIGSGPKAKAIASKAVALRKQGLPVPNIIVIEQFEYGANWSGRHGHTSGGHPLGTSPSKDVGFPYFPHFGDEVIKYMNREFSWSAFLMSGMSSWMTYGEWIDRGSPHPPHLIWCGYLNWVRVKTESETGIEFILGKVVKIRSNAGRWAVTYISRENDEVVVEADGVVITGPGDLIEVENQPVHPRVLDGRSFWMNKKTFAGATATELDAPIIIVGAGETAASIITELNEQLDRSDPPAIFVVNESGMIFSRGENYYENSIYTDPDSFNWALLSIDQRRAIINRTDRGVFSRSSLVTIDHMTNLNVMKGRADKITIDEPEGTPRLFVVDRASGLTTEVPAAFVIVSIGYNPWTFLGLFDDELKEQMTAARDGILDTIQRDLSVDWLALSSANGLPKIHLPMLAGIAQGPGFPNLSSLGTLADRVLAAYLNED